MNVKASNQVSSYFLFFLMHSAQTGLSFLNFQSKIIKGAGNDSWLVLIILGLITQILFIMMVFILKHSSSQDIISFHIDVFGKFFGGTLNVLMAFYFSLASLYVLYSYINILQIWVFDEVATWEFSLILVILIFYIVSGGFRVITAIAFWGVIIPSFMLMSLFYLLRYSDITYILPFFNHSMKDYLISAKEAMSLFFGFETVLVYFPFIKDGEKNTKWGHIALIYTAILYTIIAVVTFLFFTQEKLKYLTWPTLTMIKVIKFSFLERFEFIFIFTWLLVILPVICLYLWSTIRSLKFTFKKIKPTYFLIGILIIFHLYNIKYVEIRYYYFLSNIVNYIGLTFILIYVPILFVICFIRERLKNKWKTKTSDQ